MTCSEPMAPRVRGERSADRPADASRERMCGRLVSVGHRPIARPGRRPGRHRLQSVFLRVSVSPFLKLVSVPSVTSLP